VHDAAPWVDLFPTHRHTLPLLWRVIRESTTRNSAWRYCGELVEWRPLLPTRNPCACRTHTPVPRTSFPCIAGWLSATSTGSRSVQSTGPSA